MDFKNTNADRTTETQNLVELDRPTENIYESVVIISKRADQINDQMREELHDKLEEFATSTETLEEIFDNKEQIEVSKYYENLPKPTAIAATEWKESKIYYRHTDEEKEEQTSED